MLLCWDFAQKLNPLLESSREVTENGPLVMTVQQKRNTGKMAVEGGGVGADRAVTPKRR